MSSADLPRVTVVVVAHDSADVIGGCLASIPREVPGTASIDVVVADNASSDGTIGVVRAVAPHASIYRLAANEGYAAGINAGCRAAPGGTGDAVLVLNPDVRLQPGSIGALFQSLRSPGCGIAVPRMVDDAGRLQPSLRREPTVLRSLGAALLGGRRAGRVPLLGEVVTDRRAYAEAHVVDWATGAAMLVSRACLERVGPWDESFFLYSEEVDFALRARDAGFTVRYEPAAEVVHLGGESNTDPALWSLLTRNRIEAYRRRHGRLRTTAFAAAVALNEAARAVAGPGTHRAALRGLLTGGPRSHRHGGGGGVICFSAQDWWYFNRAHSDFQLATRVAAHRPVLLVNSLGMRLPVPGRTTRPWARLARKAASMGRGLRRPLADVPGFAVLTPVFLPVYRDGRLRDANTRFVAWQVRRAARRVGVGDDAVAVVTLPTAWEVARRVAKAGVIAYRSDRYSAFAEADRDWVAGLERELLAAADTALYSSPGLREQEAGMSRRTDLLDHGVDLARFRLAADLAEAPELREVPRPRVGFFGAIDDYTVDLDLLDRVARELPDVQVVVVGPSNRSMAALTARPNVHWFGPRPAEAVPAFGAGFDVAIMPWLDNEWIRASNPVKLKEYLALGLPVVTTPFPGTSRYAGLIEVAEGPDAFLAAIRRGLAGDAPGTPASRRAAVLGDSWDERAAELLRHCDEIGREAACAAS